jgi:hypothetical protein
MLSLHYLISGPSKEASSSTTLTTTTSRRDEYSQGVIKDTPTTRELLRAPSSWTKHLHLLLIALCFLLGTTRAAQAPGIERYDDRSQELLQELDRQKVTLPTYFDSLKPTAAAYELRYLTRVQEAINYGVKFYESESISSLKNTIYNVTPLNNTKVTGTVDPNEYKLKIYQANVLAQGMILAGEFWDPVKREGENDDLFQERVKAVYGTIGNFDDTKEVFDFGSQKLIERLPLRMQRIVASIIQNDPDVVCLQELDLIELFSVEMDKAGYKLVGYQQKRAKNRNCHTVSVMRNGGDEPERDVDGAAIYIKKDGRLQIAGQDDEGFQNTKCAVCHGKGKVASPQDDEKTGASADTKCPRCNGLGITLQNSSDETGFMGHGGRGIGLPLSKNFKLNDNCLKCSGSGKEKSDEDKSGDEKRDEPATDCVTCNGTGKHGEENNVLKVLQRPAANEKWKQIMVHAHLQLVKDNKNVPMAPVNIDIFTFHGKSGDAASQIPVKIAQAKYAAEEIAKVKALRQDTHLFFPCDFNTHITNNVTNADKDTYTQFMKHLTEREVPVKMTSAYKDVLGQHPEWTCVKTRGWPDHQAKMPNQPNKIGTTSNSIDYLGHCDNSVTISVSNLLVQELDKDKYPVTFPSIHAFSDHGVPLVADFLLKCKPQDNSTNGVGEYTNVLADMTDVKYEATRNDVKIKTAVTLREFGRFNDNYVGFQNRTPISKYETVEMYIAAMKDFVAIKWPKKSDEEKMWKPLNDFITKIKKAGKDVYAYATQKWALERQLDHLEEEHIDVRSAERERQAAAQANQKRLDAFLESDQKFMWYKERRAPGQNPWQIYSEEDQQKLFRAFMIDGEKECQVGPLFTVKLTEHLSKEAREKVLSTRWSEASPEDGQKHLDRIDAGIYFQETNSNGWVRPVDVRMTAKRRRRLANGARTSPVLAALMEKIEEAKREYTRM